MELAIDERVMDLFPGLMIAVFEGSITSVKPDVVSEIRQMREGALERLRSQVISADMLSGHPHVGAWRTAYERFGVKAKTHKPTHEALARRLLRGGDWPSINPIVDVYLTSQVKHLLPHGGYDVTKLSGTVRLSLCAEQERFEPLGGGSELTEVGEIVYRDADRILTRRWNYRDCDATKICEETRSFCVMVERPSEMITEESIRETARDLASQFQRCFDGTFLARMIGPTLEQRGLTV